MKKIYGFLISLICLLSFASSVSAISSSISVYNDDTYEFIDGLEVNYYRASSYPVYVLDIDTYFTDYTKLTDPQIVSSGFEYIINNSNQTNNSEKNYYITQVAILWYEDYLNGNDNNISNSIKTYIRNNINNNTICYYINKLVNNAKNYNDDNYISISNNGITFTRNGNYYYSNLIYVDTYNLNNTPTVGVYNAPKNTEIINENLYDNGNGSFKIRIPVSSLNKFNKDDFEVYVKGYTSNKAVYKYSYNGITDALYGNNYSSGRTEVEESIPVVINNMVTNGSVRIEVLDYNGNNIRNVKYYIYKGNCENTTCSSSDYVTQFTTNGSYTNFDGLLTTGTYTLVRQTDTKYDLKEKEVIEVTDRQTTQTIYIYEIGNANINISKRIVIVTNSINDYSNIIKIYNSNGTLVDSYRSDNTRYNISLSKGNYYIIDSKNTMRIDFEISEDGRMYIIENNNKVERNSINLDDYIYRNNYEENNNNINDGYVSNGNEIINSGNSGNGSFELSQEIKTETTIDWISNVIDCPKTSISSTIKYIIGAIILATGILLTCKNVKKHKNNI